MNRNQETCLAAAEQLIEKCFNLTPDKIAEVEAQLMVMGLGKLADLARTQGLLNCGDNEYIPLFEVAMARKFNGSW